MILTAAMVSIATASLGGSGFTQALENVLQVNALSDTSATRFVQGAEAPAPTVRFITADPPPEGLSDQVEDAPADAVASNDTCPVSGDPIDPDGAKVTYHSQVYGFCCDGCIDQFRADPDKYTHPQ